MEHWRYGKFRFRDYISSLFAIAFMLVLVVIGFLTSTRFTLLIGPLAFLVIMVWSLYIPNRERFSISGDIITTIQGRKKRGIVIPHEPTLVVSYADVCLQFAKGINCGNQTHLLKGRYAVSILRNMPLETALKQLHQKYMRKYTNSTIEAVFDDYQYVYSFVCNQELLQLVTHRSCQIIIPETLLHQLLIDSSQANIFIDTGY